MDDGLGDPFDGEQNKKIFQGIAAAKRICEICISSLQTASPSYWNQNLELS